MQPAIYFQLGFFRTAVSEMYKVAIRMSPNEATTMAKSKTRWPKGDCSFCFLMKLKRFILYFDLRAAE